jgi:thiamine-monophosphate kinase
MQLDPKDRTELEALGEFALIERLTSTFDHHHKSTVKGVGDDAAVLDAGEKYALVSTDLLIEGVHFDLTYAPLKHLGYKAVTVNLSDIYAMNGTPKQITVSVAVSNRFSLEALQELYQGIKTACDIYKIDLVGGDTSSSLTGLCISVTSIGEVDKNKVAYRNGAKENDLVVVSGDLGGAYAGLQLLEREKQIFQEDSKIQPDLEGKDYVLERQLKPEARPGVIDLLSEAGVVPTSMIDVSDGLASEMLHLCKNSGVGVRIYEDKLPIDPVTVNTCEELGLDHVTAALNGGEDYELLFTIKQEHFETVNRIDGLSIIGHITDKNVGYSMVGRADNLIPLTAQGWDAFLKNG